MAVNGATGHAFAHILYKALLFMGAGAVIYVTGRRKLTELGGLYAAMPLTVALYMVGAFAISAFPFFSGFVTKSMVVAAAGQDHRALVVLALTMASSGTFLHTGLKLPYYMFFGKDRGIRAPEPPRNMLVAMGLAAAACILIGVFPALLYRYLPFPVDYAPYTARHVVATLGLLGFTALGFFMLLKHLDPEPIVSLDTDWFYRRGSSAILAFAEGGLARAEGVVGRTSDVVMHRFVLGAGARLREVDARVIDAAAVGVGRLTQAVSRGLSIAVSGHAQHYGLIMAAGVLVAIAIALLRW
jgi:multicomponent Na+:H+ antiporter subunit D